TKGGLFLLLAILSGLPLLLSDAAWHHRLSWLIICIWSSCRFYYFIFHVLHSYVDPTLKSAGVIDLIRKL
ncbi:MAG: hypothetical protein ACPG4K_12685, partial [Haloferula sp.]